MIAATNVTHDRGLKSWVDSANGHQDFPIQNLPLCVFSVNGAGPRGGIAIGDDILDLELLSAKAILPDDDLAIIRVAARAPLNAYFALSSESRHRFRAIISEVLSQADPLRLREAGVTVSQHSVTYHIPADVGDYTDFFAGIHHAKTAGKMFRPDNPLLPNYKHVPIAYHGRSSSVRVSGHPVVHPDGQCAAHGATEPDFGPSRRLDFELEIAIWISGGNELGSTIPVAAAGDEIVGFGLLNDWSARDIQAWETQPLGPFLGKNFLTTVSPFVVTAEALAPFRKPQPPRDAGDPKPLPYLFDQADQDCGAFDIALEILISTPKMRAEGHDPFSLTRASGLDLYWTPAQMVAHHSSNGCNLRPGDLFGTGTVSGPGPNGHGSLLELTSGGREPVTLPTGETRTFLEDGDEVIFRGWCERDGFARIGFGEARGTIVPSLGVSVQ